MAKTQYFTATSVDGYIADQRNSLDWLFEVDRGEAADSSFAGFFAEVGAMAMGRTTYEWVLEHDRLLEDPGKWRSYYADTPCWVFTHRDLAPVRGANLSFVHGDVAPVHDDMTGPRAGRTCGWSVAASWSVSSPTRACWTRSCSPSLRSRWAAARRFCLAG